VSFKWQARVKSDSNCSVNCQSILRASSRVFLPSLGLAFLYEVSLDGFLSSSSIIPPIRPVIFSFTAFLFRITLPSLSVSTTPRQVLPMRILGPATMFAPQLDHQYGDSTMPGHANIELSFGYTASHKSLTRNIGIPLPSRPFCCVYAYCRSDKGISRRGLILSYDWAIWRCCTRLKLSIPGL
jgi:hypothetical protein